MQKLAASHGDNLYHITTDLGYYGAPSEKKLRLIGTAVFLSELVAKSDRTQSTVDLMARSTDKKGNPVRRHDNWHPLYNVGEHWLGTCAQRGCCLAGLCAFDRGLSRVCLAQAVASLPAVLRGGGRRELLALSGCRRPAAHGYAIKCDH